MYFVGIYTVRRYLPPGSRRSPIIWIRVDPDPHHIALIRSPWDKCAPPRPGHWPHSGRWLWCCPWKKSTKKNYTYTPKNDTNEKKPSLKEFLTWQMKSKKLNNYNNPVKSLTIRTVASHYFLKDPDSALQNCALTWSL